jgi:hypothetical protein
LETADVVLMSDNLRNNPEKWDELLDLFGSYLLYARREYGVEPDLFSFNESNIGINVGLTPESHAQAIKRIGAYFQKLGLKTKMLLGDARSPRDTYRFVLEAASDPDAFPFIGAVGVSLLGRRHAGAVRGVGRCGQMAGASAAGDRNGRRCLRLLHAIDAGSDFDLPRIGDHGNDPPVAVVGGLFACHYWQARE